MASNWQQQGFWEGDAPEVTGNQKGALAYSREQRIEILREFKGELPQSIMQARFTSRSDEPAKNSYDQTNIRKNPTEDMEFTRGIGNVRMGGLSQFPWNIGRSLMLLYSRPGDLVIDPFAGHNSRMGMVVPEGRHYQGYDISEEFMRFNFEERERLQQVYPDSGIRLHHQDSRSLSESATESGDFTITSPPYYNIENYGDEPEQLGKAKTYEAFLEELGEVAKENCRVLKPGAFAAWFVNDFRKDWRFYPYHMDVCNLMQSAGFTLFDLMIVDFGPSIRAAFASQIVKERIIPKRHEYGLIFQKGRD